MPHRQPMTDAEALLVTDPAAFLKKNVLIPKRPNLPIGQLKMVTYFRLVAATTRDGAITGKTKNRRGKTIPAWDLQEDVNGPIHAYYLHYAYDKATPGTLGVDAGDPDFFITAAMNGCSFSFAQNGNAAAGLVAHHNAMKLKNTQQAITAQPHAAGAEFVHQADYRKSRGGALDTSYEAAIVGRRESSGKWSFFVQSRKGSHYGKSDAPTWRVKDVTECNPDRVGVDLPEI